MSTRIRQDFSTVSLVMIPVAIAINIAVGQLIFSLKSPLYLDSIGTVLVGVFAAVRALASGGETTVVMIEHKLEWVAEFADRVIALAGGRVVGDGRPAEVLPDDSLVEHDIGQTRYTLAAHRARALGLWLPSRSLPATLAEAVEGFERVRRET